MREGILGEGYVELEDESFFERAKTSDDLLTNGSNINAYGKRCDETTETHHFGPFLDLDWFSRGTEDPIDLKRWEVSEEMIV